MNDGGDRQAHGDGEVDSPESDDRLSRETDADSFRHPLATDGPRSTDGSTERGRDSPTESTRDGRHSDSTNEESADSNPPVDRTGGNTRADGLGSRPATATTSAHEEPRQRGPRGDREEGHSGFDERVGMAIRAIQEGTKALDSELLREYTTDRRDLHSSVRIQWGLFVALGTLVASFVLTNVLGALGQPLWLGAVVFGVLFALGMVWVELRYRAWLYQVRADSLYLERGVLTHRRTHVPYVRIQHVDTSRGPIERSLGLSTLVVYTAGSRGADVSIPGLVPEEASDLQQRVKQLAIDADGDDAL